MQLTYSTVISNYSNSHFMLSYGTIYMYMLFDTCTLIVVVIALKQST